jgi:hypothetical protein
LLLVALVVELVLVAVLLVSFALGLAHFSANNNLSKQK